MSNNTDSLYAIGDLQGCYESLVGLLDQLPNNAPLVFLGDIVNRGPDSLKTLRAVKSMCDSGRAKMVLGNHDLHLLALVAAGRQPKKKDTLNDILRAEDFPDLIDWLRRQPLIVNAQDTLFVHAGIPPNWSLNQALSLAHEVEDGLRCDAWKDYLKDMYGSERFDVSLKGSARMRAILNSLTRMRFLDQRGELDFSIKEGIARKPEGFTPWFEHPRLIKHPICFGHWSMLGLVLRENTIAVDTGCLWGGALSAVRISDKRLYQEPCPEWAAPGC